MLSVVFMDRISYKIKFDFGAHLRACELRQGGSGAVTAGSPDALLRVCAADKARGAWVLSWNGTSFPQRGKQNSVQAFRLHAAPNRYEGAEV